MARLRPSWLAFVAILASSSLEAQRPAPGAFPVPPPLPCAGPNVVPEAVQELAARVAVATRALDSREPGAWRPLRDLAEAACLAGDRVTLAAAYERCVRECRDPGDRYLARLDYAGVLERFGDAEGAEREYLAAIALRPGRPTEAIEAYNRYALWLDRQGRPQDALAVLERFTPEERGAYSFAATLRLWVMRELGMDMANEPVAVPPAGFAAGGIRSPVSPLARLPGQPDLTPIEPLAVEVQGEVVVGPPRMTPPGASSPARGRLEFTRMGTRDPTVRPGELRLAKGDIFTVVAELGGDGCRIAYGPTTYDLVACPWRSSSSDRQRDLYRVLGRRATERAVADLAAAVPMPEPFSPVGPFLAESSGPTETDAWRGFYSSVEVTARVTQRAPSEVLAERVALTAAEAAAVMAAARDFLAAIAAVDDGARREIAARFGSPLPPFAPGALPLPPGRGSRPSVLVPGVTPDGRSVQEVLAAEGFMERVAERKAAALAAHRTRLAQVLGPVELAALAAALPDFGRASFALQSGPAVLLPERTRRTVRTSAADAAIVGELAPELEGAELGAVPGERVGVTAYRFERDFDGNGRLELVLLGRYAGNRSFALVASLNGNFWERAALFSFAEPELHGEIDPLYAQRLTILFCAACDSGGWLQWDGASYVFRPLPPRGPGD